MKFHAWHRLKSDDHESRQRKTQSNENDSLNCGYTIDFSWKAERYSIVYDKVESSAAQGQVWVTWLNPANGWQPLCDWIFSRVTGNEEESANEVFPRWTAQLLLNQYESCSWWESQLWLCAARYLNVICNEQIKKEQFKKINITSDSSGSFKCTTKCNF